MRKIITVTFVSLDGVMQAPGGSEEDKSEGFDYGGWQLTGPEDKVADKIIDRFMTMPFELLLGHKTYEIFASYWPFHPEIENVAIPFNKTKKYVVSHKSVDLSWKNSELITGDVVEEIEKLKKMDAPDLVVWGSSKLIQTLLSNNLIDQMNIMTYPLTIGTGKKLFSDGTLPERFKLVRSEITPTGVIFAAYEPTEPLKVESK